MKVKEPVRLRTKKLKDGTRSIYLDIYHDGIRQYEFLKLYLIPEKTRDDKRKNEVTMQLANAIKSKRIVSLQNRQFGFKQKDLLNADLLAYITTQAEKCQKHGHATVDTCKALADKLKAFTKKEVITFGMVDKAFVSKFLEYLQNTKFEFIGRIRYKSPRKLRQSTVYTYYAMLKSMLARAVVDEIISENPCLELKRTERPKLIHRERCYLTEEELKAFYLHRDEVNPFVRTIFMFGCYTGLRYSDIITLEWSHLTKDSSGTYHLSKKQVKTENVIEFPLSKSAARLLPANGGGCSLVFGTWKTLQAVNYQVDKWTKAAGVKKHISFHCSRHTFATLMLTKGADIYTVSKLLGHRSIATTQVYAKIVDDVKRKAIDLLPDFEDGG